MRYITIILGICLFALINLPNISITLTLKEAAQGTVLYLKNGSKLDSAVVVDGIATFTTLAGTKPYMVSIFTKDRKFNYPLYIETRNIKLSGSFLSPKKLSVEGSDTQKDFIEYLAIVEPMRESANYKARKLNFREADSIRRIILSTEKDFSKKHPNSLISVMLPYFAFRNKSITARDAISWLSTMKKMQDSTVSGYIKEIEGFKQIKDGTPATELSGKDVVTNKMIKLSDYKNKTVILTFWASWCGPCIGEIPLFKKFVENNKSNPDIVFLSISIDTIEDDLKKAIEKYTITYPVIADYNEKSPIIRNYGIGALPITYIINKDGKIKEIDISTVTQLQAEVD